MQLLVLNLLLRKKMKLGFIILSEKNYKKQGWKIHISSQMTDALIIFEKVSKLLLQEKCNFKVAKNSTVLAEINSPRNDTEKATLF
ncbi:hypothetical protein SDE12394_05665 [Streptococcus dysgalactiae subsp. equisimilis ATCC 12394]|nr:hypothetical protein SDE12394_05665 [Streptococcus dysgalactiae subsp. equisimilis ATCC 12394]